MRYVESARHTGYVNSKTFRNALKAMRRDMRWAGFEAYYDRLQPGEEVAPPASRAA